MDAARVQVYIRRFYFCIYRLIDSAPIFCSRWMLLLLLMPLPLSAVYAEEAATAQDTTNAVVQTASVSELSSDQTSSAAVIPFYEKSGQSSTTATVGIGSGGHLLNVTLGLLLIIGLIFALSLFVKRFGSGTFAGNSQLKILSSMPLGTRERIVLIDAAGQQLLLGITPTSINTLHVFAEPVAASTPSANSSDFSQKLMAVLQQKITPTTSKTANNNNSAAQE